MRIDVTQEAPPDVVAYASIPIAFEVQSVARVTPATHGLKRFEISTERVATPYVKDYDVDGNGPLSWPSRFDITRWAFFVARQGERRVGGAVGIINAPDVEMLAGRPDVALLWDIRVAPDARHAGVGAALMDAVEAWARSHGAAWLEVETQDVNVPACRFYARHGFALHAANRDAYPALPNETQLLWYKRPFSAAG